MKHLTILGRGAIVALATALVLTGCSSDPEETPAAGAPATTAPARETLAVSEELQAMLPADIRAAGTLTIVTDATIGEPFASYAEDNTTIVGLAPDLAAAFGEVLGMKVDLQHTTFANLIPGLAAGRYQFAVAPMLDTPERQKEVDFIDYIRGGSAFLVNKDGGKADLTLDALCGLTVGYAAGSVEEEAATTQSEKCVSEGKPAITLQAYQTNNEGVLAVVSKRTDTYITAAAQVGYIAQQDSGRVQRSGEAFRGGLSAMAFPKESPLLPVIHAVLAKMIEDGSYGNILAAYGLTDLAVDEALINSAPKS